MPKIRKRKTVKKQPEKLEAAGELQIAGGRYANHIQVGISEEEFVLDFFARLGESAVHNARIFISPNHARRLMDLLKRQITLHKRTYPNSPLKLTAPTRRKV